MSDSTSSAALQVEDLAVESRTVRLGTRVTLVPSDMLANSSFDRDEQAAEE